MWDIASLSVYNKNVKKLDKSAETPRHMANIPNLGPYKTSVTEVVCENS